MAHFYCLNKFIYMFGIDQLPSLPSDKLYKAIPSSVPNFIRVNQLFIWAAQLVQKQRSNPQDEKKTSRQSRIADKIGMYPVSFITR